MIGGAATLAILACAQPAPTHPAPQRPPPSLPLHWNSGGTGAIVGVVFGPAGQGLWGASVWIQDSKHGRDTVAPAPSVIADTTGAFVLSRVPPGKHRVWSRLIGYRGCRFTVNVAAGVADTVLIWLDSRPLILDGPSTPQHSAESEEETGYCVGQR